MIPASKTPIAESGPTGIIDYTATLQGEAAKSIRHASDILSRNLPAKKIQIYEAGGGSTSWLPPELTKRASITVVDIDPVQIENNKFADTKILGDIQTHQLPAGSIDLIVCYNVIEHLPDVEAALHRFFEAARPGGLIFIGAPNPYSLSGFVTKFSPHWFHVFYYRKFRSDPNAGKPGHAPFPTFYHPLVSPARLVAFAKSHGFDVLYDKVYESPRYGELRASHPRLARVLDIATSGMDAVCLNKIDLRRGDYHIILRKPVS